MMVHEGGHGWNGKHICTSCPVPHPDNCPDCFGFGLHKGTLSPISAHAALREDPPAWDRCKVCGGTPNGIEELT